MQIHKSLDKLPSFTNGVITIGSYDGVHHGHRKIIQRLVARAEEINGESIVITFHPHPREVLSPQDSSFILLTDIDEKVRLLEALRIDHLVIVPFNIEFSQQTPEEYLQNFILEKFDPSVIIIGYDHKYGKNRAGDFQMLQKFASLEKIEIEKIEKQDLEEITVSSTKIREQIKLGNVKTANVLLNATYTLSGKVIHGDKKGKSFGFPTANIKLNNEKKLIPKEGVYAARAKVEGLDVDGMLYIGTRPTLNQGMETRIEINLFDFSKDIYGRNIQIDMIDFVRGGQKFNTTDQLIAQLKLDEIQVRGILNKSSIPKKKSHSAIAILNFNNKDYLEAYLPKVIEYSEDTTKIYVIDNDSSDGSIDYVKESFPEISIITLYKNHGFAEGYNQAISKIEEEYIILLNSDVEVTKDWLNPLLSSIKDKDVAAVMPKIRSVAKKNHFEYAGAAGGFIDSLGYPYCRGRIMDTVEEDTGQYNTTISVDWVTGAACLIRKSLFEDLGGFDASFFAHQEEIDWCWRARRAGYTLVCNPNSVVYHVGGGSLDYESSFKTYLNFRNNLTTLLKNEPLGKLIWLFPLRLILDGVAGLKFLLAGKFGNFMSIIKSHLAVYASLLKIKKRRTYEKALIKQHSRPITAKQNPVKSIVWNYFVLNKKKYKDL